MWVSAWEHHTGVPTLPTPNTTPANFRRGSEAPRDPEMGRAPNDTPVSLSDHTPGRRGNRLQFHLRLPLPDSPQPGGSAGRAARRPRDPRVDPDLDPGPPIRPPDPGPAGPRADSGAAPTCPPGGEPGPGAPSRPLPSPPARLETWGPGAAGGRRLGPPPA